MLSCSVCTFVYLCVPVCVFMPRAHADFKSSCAWGWCRCATLLYITDTSATVFSTCECLMTPSLTCCSTWWPRSGSWICPSCSSQSTGACRTLNYSLNSNRSLAKGSSRLPWQQEPGSSPAGSTQVKYTTRSLILETTITITSTCTNVSNMLHSYMCSVKIFHKDILICSVTFYKNWVARCLCVWWVC